MGYNTYSLAASTSGGHHIGAIPPIHRCQRLLSRFLSFQIDVTNCASGEESRSTSAGSSKSRVLMHGLYVGIGLCIGLSVLRCWLVGPGMWRSRLSCHSRYAGASSSREHQILARVRAPRIRTKNLIRHVQVLLCYCLQHPTDVSASSSVK